MNYIQIVILLTLISLKSFSQEFPNNFKVGNLNRLQIGRAHV